MNYSFCNVFFLGGLPFTCISLTIETVIGLQFFMVVTHSEELEMVCQQRYMDDAMGYL